MNHEKKVVITRIVHTKVYPVSEKLGRKLIRQKFEVVDILNVFDAGNTTLRKKVWIRAAELLLRRQRMGTVLRDPCKWAKLRE